MEQYYGFLIWFLGLVAWVSIFIAMYSKWRAVQMLVEYMAPGPRSYEQRQNTLAYIKTRNEHEARFPHGTIRYSEDTFIILNADGSGTLHVRDVSIEEVFQKEWPGHKEDFAHMHVTAEDIAFFEKQLWSDLSAKLHFSIKKKEGDVCVVS
ncbi:hypothetical protein SM033_00056 [Vibrio phage vB_VpaM_sm033]|nr:hypothetical protein SM033_00056 [Vibrio phage vB_VpaM_sm033]